MSYKSSPLRSKILVAEATERLPKSSGEGTWVAKKMTTVISKNKPPTTKTIMPLDKPDKNLNFQRLCASLRALKDPIAILLVYQVFKINVKIKLCVYRNYG